MSKTKEQVTALVRSVAGRSSVLDDQTMGEIEMDSLGQVELVMAIEEEFSIEISDSDADQHFTFDSTVNSMTAYLDKKLA